MTLAIDLGSLPGPAQKVLSAAAPAPLRMMAAGGVMPGLKPGDIVTVVAVLSTTEDTAVAAKAAETLRKLPAPVLNGALSADLEPGVVTVLAEAYAHDAAVVEKLLRMPRIEDAALEALAERANEIIGELIATNEQRLLAAPRVIEKLYLNKRVRMSTADRVLELAVRNGLVLSIRAFKEAAAAIRNELIPEASEEPTFEDVIAREVDDLATKIDIDTSVEDTHDVDDEGQEILREKLVPLHARLADLTVSQKIRRATLGTSAERLLLVRDNNRLVASAAVQSPLMTENDAARIAASRQISEDVLRVIAQNREWTRSYQIKMNLVMNPRTPFTFSSRLVPHLRENDVRGLSRNKNVPSSIQQAARQQLLRKASGKKD